ncbi:hypothetical protein [Arthrobacter sp.]|uniref:hypothetical protein n=1 Tax=Arthrobacter sp. TaxID=1667 RepID=UPI0028117713|nr:hypothetical protein [Arthrobacter sp.]
MTRAQGTGALGLTADDLPPAKAGIAALSTRQLKRMCDEYFSLLDQVNPPECLLADYGDACDELAQRLTLKRNARTTL